MTTCLPIAPALAFDPLTLLQTKLAEQCKQVSEVMAQNVKLMATLSKGGGGGGSSRGGGGSGGSGGGSNGGGGGGGNNNDGRHQTPWKEKKLCPNCNKTVVHKPVDCFSLKGNKDTRTNVQRDGVTNAANDRDQGPAMMILYNNG